MSAPRIGRDEIQEPVERLVHDLAGPCRVHDLDRDSPSVEIHQENVTPRPQMAIVKVDELMRSHGDPT